VASHFVGPQDRPLTTQEDIQNLVSDQVFLRIEPLEAVSVSKENLRASVIRIIGEISVEKKILMNQQEQQFLADSVLDEMIGLGPLEPFLADNTINDILVNGPQSIYVERRGKLEFTNRRFRNDAHVLHLAQRIASSIGRRIDESSPMLDARLADGSRVNVIIPPLSIKGPCISIRKFSKTALNFNKFRGWPR